MTIEKKIPYELKFTLASLRVRMLFTQDEAAKMLGITRDTLRTYEKDSSKIDYKMIKKMEELYHIPQDYIFFGEDNAFSGMLEKENTEE